MPAKKLAEHFHPEMRRPTKELYSIAVLLFVMEFRDWTHAEDLSFLVERYRRNKKHNTRSTFAMLVKVFEQQCDVIDQKVTVKKKTGGEIIFNPSDLGATFCGHKGPGY